MKLEEDIIFTVDTNNTNLDDYEKLLSRFQTWKEFNREIKLTNLLEGKKVQYTVDDIRNHNIYGLLEKSDIEPDIRVSDIAFHVKKMIFVINDGVVESLKIRVKVLDTPQGKQLNELLLANIPMTIRQFKINDKVKYFYTDFFQSNVA